MPDAATAPAPPSPARRPAAAPSLDEFNDEVESFLEANARRKEAEKKFVWGEGSDTVSMFEERDRDAEGALLAAACAWRAKRFDAGLGWITGPPELGGRGLSSAHQRVYDTLESQVRRPQPELLHDRARHGRADDRRPRQHGRQGPLPAGDVPRRHRRLSAVLRAGRRQRPGEPADQGRARRRRVGDHRAEGVDHRRPLLRHRRDHRPHRSRTSPSTRVSPGSSSTCGRPASRCGRCVR